MVLVDDDGVIARRKENVAPLLNECARRQPANRVASEYHDDAL
jgi:hypothetical protein